MLKFSHLFPSSLIRMIKRSRFYLHYVIFTNGGGLYSPRVSYSQRCEDCITQGMFYCLGIDKPSYIDIGANSPYFLSNTAIFHEHGSRGINIEPNPILFKDIALARKNDTNLMIGIGTSEGELPFYEMSADTLSTFSEEEAKKLCDKNGYRIIKVIPVKVKTLKSIVDEYCGGVFPDFMSLDTEGLDEMILSTLKDCPSLPKIICTETWEYGLKENHIHEVCAILEPLGYMLFLDNNLNSIFVLKDLWEAAINSKRA